MNADMLRNNNIQQIVTEIFIRNKKLNISLVFITQSHCAVPKNITLNSVLLLNFQTNKSFNKSQLIVHQILNSNVL